MDNDFLFKFLSPIGIQVFVPMSIQPNSAKQFDMKNFMFRKGSECISFMNNFSNKMTNSQPDKDVHISLEDQQKINKFARHNQKMEVSFSSDFLSFESETVPIMH